MTAPTQVVPSPRGSCGAGPVAAFVELTFALSWVFWLLLYVTSSPACSSSAGWAMAAAIVASQLGTAAVAGASAALAPGAVLLPGFPVLLYGVPNVIVALFGASPDLSLLGERLPAYAVMWAAALFMSGLKEPGWRGLALPRLQSG